jgi:hypothetical protein
VVTGGVCVPVHPAKEIMAESMIRVTRVLDCIPDDSGYKEYDACAGETRN